LHCFPVLSVYVYKDAAERKEEKWPDRLQLRSRAPPQEID
jgi:hypothetical protein